MSPFLLDLLNSERVSKKKPSKSVRFLERAGLQCRRSPRLLLVRHCLVKSQGRHGQGWKRLSVPRWASGRKGSQQVVVTPMKAGELKDGTSVGPLPT